MNYQQHLKELQIQRLRVRQKHMDVLLSYHTLMEDETKDPRVRELHHLQACELNEALAYLDKLIQTLEQPYAT
jgi:hypothetical protein